MTNPPSFPPLIGDESLRQLHAIKNQNPFLFKGIPMTGKGRTLQMITKEMQHRIQHYNLISAPLPISRQNTLTPKEQACQLKECIECLSDRMDTLNTKISGIQKGLSLCFCVSGPLLMIIVVVLTFQIIEWYFWMQCDNALNANHDHYVPHHGGISLSNNKEIGCWLEFRYGTSSVFDFVDYFSSITLDIDFGIWNYFGYFQRVISPLILGGICAFIACFGLKCFFRVIGWWIITITDFGDSCIETLLSLLSPLQAMWDLMRSVLLFVQQIPMKIRVGIREGLNSLNVFLRDLVFGLRCLIHRVWNKVVCEVTHLPQREMHWGHYGWNEFKIICDVVFELVGSILN